MKTNRDFTNSYEQVINLIKQFKTSNDRINKSIGVQN